MKQRKRYLLSLVIAFLTVSVYAQKDITKFLGIPVDGTKSEMVNQLKAKGFKYDSDLDCLFGEFNGREVSILIGMNKDKVWRIVLTDVEQSDEIGIKIRFNTLCRQFLENKKYTSPISDYTIPQSEDISYEILVNKKRYEASFYQAPDNIDKFLNDLNTHLLQFFTDEEINNPSDIIKSKIEQIGADYMIEVLSKKLVWFMIHEQFGKYRIAMYYENAYNGPNGEDL